MTVRLVNEVELFQYKAYLLKDRSVSRVIVGFLFCIHDVCTYFCRDREGRRDWVPICDMCNVIKDQ